MQNQYDLAFLQDKIGAEYVELNPATGNPRLIPGLNEVYRAIEELGGMELATDCLSVTEEEIDTWIDQHYVSTEYALDIASELGFSDITDLQSPTTGYADPKTGFCWPVSWWLSCGVGGEVGLLLRGKRGPALLLGLGFNLHSGSFHHCSCCGVH